MNLEGCCEYVSGEMRCHYPGVYKTSTLGEGRWMCSAHDKDPSSQTMGALIVDKSHEDIPFPDNSLERRRARFEAKVVLREPGMD
jgi:hypothetical protein